MKFDPQNNNFHWRTLVWKCRLQNDGLFSSRPQWVHEHSVPLLVVSDVTFSHRVLLWKWSVFTILPSLQWKFWQWEDKILNIKPSLVAVEEWQVFSYMYSTLSHWGMNTMTYYRLQVDIHFLQWRSFNFDWNFTDVGFWSQIDNNSALV